jgi:predicted  nucleic acid-binding Zn-ribbon protein
MTNARLFDKLRTLIEDARDVDKKHIKKLRKVLGKLKERQNELRDKLEDVDNPSERRKMEQEIAVISLQRGKGVEVYRQLKAARKQRKEGNTSDIAGLAPNPDEPGKTS